MKLLYKTIYGSRLYGTSTDKSDHDYIVIFAPELADLMTGKPVKRFSENTNSKGKNTSKDIDISYVPIHTFLDDFHNGQPYAIEVAFSMFAEKMDTKVYDIRFADLCTELIDNWLTCDVKAFLGFAKSNLSKAEFYTQHQLAIIENRTKGLKLIDAEASERKALYHAVRAYSMALEILNTGWLKLPYTYSDELKDIKSGKMSSSDAVELIKPLVEQLPISIAKCPFKRKHSPEAMQLFKERWIMEYYFNAQLPDIGISNT
mgnify:CR=1 FL=1